ncbi:hypothetical protein AWH48_08395 [Domibacillus aminovorans]|uniref:Flagellin n=1 Tax=Domibacillus aminovorans TaxID=29332 RepID=A0A177KPW7_9BACI|nr:flagellar hook-associated protein FlgL [Domibacillus aminovorans]OAH54601.1 hypothetical protein AWH48_08395 [Domibacillus aminovorans]
MRINHNIQALNAYRNLNNTSNATSKSLEKLSSGLRINRAADDAAGLAISEKMRSQVRGLGMAERNSLDAISLIQTAEGALSSTHEILQRMRELSVQASNGTLEDADREAIQEEINELTHEIDRIADTTQFNQKILFSGKKEAFAEGDFTGNHPWTKTLASGESFTLTFSEIPKPGDKIEIDGTEYTFVSGTATAPDISIDSFTTPDDAAAAIASGVSDATSSGNVLTITATSDYNVVLRDADYDTDIRSLSLAFQIGANESEMLTLDLSPMDAKKLGIATIFDSVKGNATTGADVSTVEKASEAITIFDKAIRLVSAERSNLGAIQNRLEHTVTNLQTANENLTAAESRIRDLDMAKEMTQFTRNNILNQAGQAMLAQANQLPQGILQLLQ